MPPDPPSQFGLRPHICALVPVRYRPNAASGGRGYGRDLVSAVKRGYTRFDIISLNIHKTTLRWYCMAVVLRPRLLIFACLARHPANCSTALPKLRYSVVIYQWANASELICWCKTWQESMWVA